MAKTIEELERSIESWKRVRRLDVMTARESERGFLQERIEPLLKDALDALHFNTPHIRGATERLEMALEAIREEVKHIDQINEEERAAR